MMTRKDDSMSMNNIGINEVKEQNNKLDRIKKFIEEECSTYFLKDSKFKYSNSGNWRSRFNWLKWRAFEFNNVYKEKLNPFLGLQIYLYSINDDDIGNITEDDIKANNEVRSKKEDKFPFDYKGSNKCYYMLSHNVCMDVNTGNIIKKPSEFNRAQIWLCQKGKTHYSILSEGFESENNREKYFNDNLIERDYIKIKKYFKELKAKSWVSNEIILSNEINDKDCSKIKHEIDRMIREFNNS